MKKVLIIANMLFASATVFGMQGHCQYPHKAHDIDALRVDFFIRGLSEMEVVKYEEAKSNFSRDVNFKLPDGNTLLIYAVCMNQTRTVNALIKKYKVKLDVCNSQETPH